MYKSPQSEEPNYGNGQNFIIEIFKIMDKIKILYYFLIIIIIKYFFPKYFYKREIAASTSKSNGN